MSKRTGRVSYKTILKFQEYLIDQCLEGDMRIGQAISNYLGWCIYVAQEDPHQMEEDQWVDHFKKYTHRHKDQSKMVFNSKEKCESIKIIIEDKE